MFIRHRRTKVMVQINDRNECNDGRDEWDVGKSNGIGREGRGKGDKDKEA